MTTRAQRMASLEKADRMRVEGARQRRELIGAPMREVVPALINPTPELASKRLCTLFTPHGPRGRAGLIPCVGGQRLKSVFAQLAFEYPQGRRNWHDGLRLRDLSEQERRRLVLALIEWAPKDWRNASEVAA